MWLGLFSEQVLLNVQVTTDLTEVLPRHFRSDVQFAPITENDHGLYQCILEGVEGRVLSLLVVLSVTSGEHCTLYMC